MTRRLNGLTHIEGQRYREDPGLAGVGGHMVRFDQTLDGAVVSHHRSFEAERVAEQLGEDSDRPGRRLTVDLGVAVHDRTEAGVPNRRFKREGEDFVELAPAR